MAEKNLSIICKCSQIRDRFQTAGFDRGSERGD